jgi:hypothetical protein
MKKKVTVTFKEKLFAKRINGMTLENVTRPTA